MVARALAVILRKYLKIAILRKTTRNRKTYRRAALLYQLIARLSANDAAIHVQCGHMFKEAGDLASAERHYLRAARLTPDDPDLSLQLGHFYRLAGRLGEAEAAYRRAAALKPDWPEAAFHVAELYKTGWRDHAAPRAGVERTGLHRAGPVQDGAEELWELFPIAAGLAPELVPRPRRRLLRRHPEEITLARLGRRERGEWGMRRTLRGIEALRGCCIAAAPLREMQMLLDGQLFHTAALTGFALADERDDRSKRKYPFNVWYDFSHFERGRHELELRFIDARGGLRSWREEVVIAAPLAEEDFPHSDAVVCFPVDAARPLDEQVNARPSMIRPARRARLAGPVRSVLVQRVDALGDLVCSVPALQRLRQLLPDARLVGLLSPANVELARTLALFDAIVTTEFAEEPWQRRRTMPLAAQHRLRRQLAPFAFDVAIDLGETTASRPLLLLSGAPFLVGFWDDDAPWLSAAYRAHARDPVNGLESASHGAKLLGLIEWFGTLLAPAPEPVRRDDLSRATLAAYGLPEGGRYAVLHRGARLKFSQWPHYDALAALLLARTDLHLVMMSDEPLPQAPALAPAERVLRLDKRLPFDDFDALVSFCTVFVGNDSGPKHLAALRGANVVSLHMARLNWNEWGQEIGGTIISRRVPCAGCGIHYEPEDCGKGFACIAHITAEEVFAAVSKFL